MFRTLHDPAPLSSTLSTPTSSFFFFPPSRINPCAQQSGLLFGRFAEQSPLTGYEPNALVQVSSTEVTTTFLPSRKASISSTYNSGGSIVTSLAVSEVDERTDLGMLALLLLTRERQAPHHPGFHHSNRESSETHSSHVRTSTGRPVPMCSNKRKSSPDSNGAQETCSEKERINSA